MNFERSAISFKNIANSHLCLDIITSYMVENIVINVVKNKKEKDAVLNIRRRVFINEQMISEKEELDEFDKTATHIIAYLNKKPVGCARIRSIGSKVKLERLAVLQEKRGQGIGKELVLFMVDLVKKKNPEEIMINAQFYLKNYYRQFGFKPRGEVFKEAGINHIEMYLE